MAEPDSKYHLASIIITFIVFCIAMVFMAISGVGDGVVFLVDNLRAHYMFHAPFDTAPWVHYIWFPVGIWQFIWLLYGMSTLCRRDTTTGLSLYCAPGCIPMSTYSMFFCAIVSTVCMQVALSHGYLDMAFGFSFLMSVTLFLCMYFSLEQHYKKIPAVVEAGRENEVALMRGLHHNGLGLYAGWADALTCLLFGKVLMYYTDLDGESAGITALTLYAVYYIIGTVIDLTIWDKFIRNMVTANFVPVLLLIGIVTHSIKWDSMTQLDYIILIVLMTMFVLLIIRISQTGRRNKRDAKLGKTYRPR